MPITLDDLEIFCIEPDNDTRLFDCGDEDLNDFVRNDCHQFRKEWLAHTLLARIRDAGMIVGFVALVSDSIVLETREKKRLIPFHKQVFHFPAVKVARLAVQTDYQRQGVGGALLDYSVGVAYRMNTDLAVGCRFLTVDAYPKSVSWYERYGFEFNQRENKQKTGPNRSMRYDLLKSVPAR